MAVKIVTCPKSGCGSTLWYKVDVGKGPFEVSTIRNPETGGYDAIVGAVLDLSNEIRYVCENNHSFSEAWAYRHGVMDPADRKFYHKFFR